MKFGQIPKWASGNHKPLQYIYLYLYFSLYMYIYVFWIDKRFIIEGIEIILNNNSFQFNNVNYMQTRGTAMETKWRQHTPPQPLYI